METDETHEEQQIVTGHVAQCEECDEPSYPLADVASPTVAGLCAAHGPKKTVEHWARAKGMLPEFTEGKKLPNARPKAKPPLIHNPKYAHFHAAKHGHRWPIGMELTEAEFDQAVADTQAHVYR